MPYGAHFVTEGIRFAGFAFVCGCLLRPRFGPRGTGLTAAGFLLGILALQAGLLWAGLDGALVLALLPVTGYLPAVVGVHMLSRASFPQTASVWWAGALAGANLLCLQKLAEARFSQAALPVLLGAAAGFGLVSWALRRRFQAYVLENRSGWLALGAPTLLLVLLLLYGAETGADPVFLLLLFLTELAVLGLAARALVWAASLRRGEEALGAAALQGESLRRGYEGLRRKMEQGRSYRHDMRRHFQALAELLRQGKTREGLEYLETLDGQLTQLQQEAFCENPTGNAVLSHCVELARKENCRVTAKAVIPRESAVEEADLCVILAGGMENAMGLCRQNAEEGDRWIRLSATAHENGNLSVKIENSCPEPVALGADGLPMALPGERPGMGLKRVEAAVGKYDGILQCEWDDGVFRLRAVLFAPQEHRPGKKQTARHGRNLPPAGAPTEKRR